jgi:serine protease Do
VTAVFNSGTKSERAVPATVIADDEARDLAVLRVKGLDAWPKPIQLNQKATLIETMPVYILGFPFGESLSFNKGHPAITVNKGSVSSLRENEYGQMKAVQIDGAINPGNSGGPVVDEEGRLVGISVATIRGSGIGLAIAPDELTHMFEGRISTGVFHELRFDDKGAEYRIEIPLIDPENQIKSVTLLYLVGTTNLAPPKPNSEGKFEPLAGAERLELKVEPGKATGILKLTFDGPGTRFINFQTLYVNGSGKQIYTPALSKQLQRSTEKKAAPAT